MAWTTPPTLTDGQVLTGAHTQIWRDDLLETAAAKATTAGRIFVATGANGLAERVISSATVSTSQSINSATYTDLATTGPTLSSVTTGPAALTFHQCNISNSSVSAITAAGVQVSGATPTTGAVAGSTTDDDAIVFQPATASGGGRLSMAAHWTSLTPGANNFQMKYRNSAGTGTWATRKLTVIAL